MTVAIKAVGSTEEFDWHDRRYAFLVFDAHERPQSGARELDASWSFSTS